MHPLPKSRPGDSYHHFLTGLAKDRQQNAEQGFGVAFAVTDAIY